MYLGATRSIQNRASARLAGTRADQECAEVRATPGSYDEAEPAVFLSRRVVIAAATAIHEMALPVHPAIQSCAGLPLIEVRERARARSRPLGAVLFPAHDSSPSIDL